MSSMTKTAVKHKLGFIDGTLSSFMEVFICQSLGVTIVFCTDEQVAAMKKRHAEKRSSGGKAYRCY